jgi:hypothetical protein
MCEAGQMVQKQWLDVAMDLGLQKRLFVCFIMAGCPTPSGPSSWSLIDDAFFQQDMNARGWIFHQQSLSVVLSVPALPFSVYSLDPIPSSSCSSPPPSSNHFPLANRLTQSLASFSHLPLSLLYTPAIASSTASSGFGSRSSCSTPSNTSAILVLGFQFSAFSCPRHIRPVPSLLTFGW